RLGPLIYRRQHIVAWHGFGGKSAVSAVFALMVVFQAALVAPYTLVETLNRHIGACVGVSADTVRFDHETGLQSYRTVCPEPVLFFFEAHMPRKFRSDILVQNYRNLFLDVVLKCIACVDVLSGNLQRHSVAFSCALDISALGPK